MALYETKVFLFEFLRNYKFALTPDEMKGFNQKDVTKLFGKSNIDVGVTTTVKGPLALRIERR